MKLYVTYTSPYGRLARIFVIEKELEDRVEIIEAKNTHHRQPLLPDQSVWPRARQIHCGTVMSSRMWSSRSLK